MAVEWSKTAFLAKLCIGLKLCVGLEICSQSQPVDTARALMKIVKKSNDNGLN